MTFQFPDTFTERVDFRALLGGQKDFPPEYLQQINAARQRVCDTMASQPACQALLDVIDAYLPFVLNLLDYSDTHPKFEKIQKFKWRSVLSKGIRMSLASTVIEKPTVSCHSLHYEAVYLLLSYAFTLANMANRLIGPSLSSAGEAACNEAADLLSRAAGVFRSAAASVAPRWTSPPKERPPECSTDMLVLLAELMVADANRVVQRKAVLRGLSPPTLIKLGVAIASGYEQCAQMLKRLSARDLEEMADPFASYVQDGARLAEALLLRRHAEAKHEASENGVAVACITQAYNQLVRCEHAEHAAWRREAMEMVPEIDALRSKYIRINNNITYQRVCELGEAKATLPVGCPIAVLKSHVLPAPIGPAGPPSSAVAD